MKDRMKQIGLLCLGGTLLALLLLSMVLTDLQFEPGQPIPGPEDTRAFMQSISAQLASGSPMLPLAEALLGVLLVVLMIYVPTRLVSMIDFRKLAEWLIAGVLLVALLSLLPSLLVQLPSSKPEIQMEPAAGQPPPVSPGSFGAGPSLLFWIAAAAFLIGGAVLLARLGARGIQRPLPERALAQTVEQALDDLSAGVDFANVIVNCYMRMSMLLRAERKLERQRTMTVREFEAWLGEKGVPQQPIHRLTTLFEKARYSSEAMSRDDEQLGRECLAEIARSCGGPETEGPWTGS